MSLRVLSNAALLVCLSAPSALSQTVFNEVEPNGTKPEATVASCLVAGDVLRGTSTGASQTTGSSLISTADMFRVRTCTLPLGIYRHELTLTASSGALATATIRGLDQSAGVAGTTDLALQNSVNAVNTWYGFGKQEEIYYMVSGSGSSTGTYSATLTTTPITATSVAGVFTPGNITISCQNQGHFTDTELWLYDSSLTAIPCGGDDDNGATQSLMTLPLTAGTYYLAVSTYNMANNHVAAQAINGCPSPDTYLYGNILDFPDAIADSEIYSGGVNLQFSVSDGTNTTVQPATKSASLSIEWFRIQVGNATPPVVPFCSGDGSGAACPCGNPGAANNGCASSVSSSGAHLAGVGGTSIGNDTLVLQGSSMPNSSALYFQGTQRIASGAGTVFGDGLRCAGGSVIRLGTKLNVAGSSSYPGAGNTAISVKGNDAAGNVRDYQCWYRNAAAFCTPSTFNLTNGVEATWVP